MSLSLNLVPTPGSVIEALQEALLTPPDHIDFAERHHLNPGLMPTWGVVYVFNALIGALEVNLARLAIPGTRPDGSAQNAYDEDDFTEAILADLAAIIDEPNPLTNEAVLDFLVVAYNSARCCCDHGLFICASDEQRLAFWPIVQALAAWLVEMITPEQPDDDNNDVLPD